MKILKLSDFPEYLERAAVWFSDKWDIPAEIYKESIQTSIDHKESIPQWYITLDESLNIIAGFGIIENDFHERKDLSPNLCALYVEEDYRNLNIARKLLDFAKNDPELSKAIFDYQNQGYKVLIRVPKDGLPVFAGKDTVEFIKSKNGQRIIRGLAKDKPTD